MTEIRPGIGLLSPLADIPQIATRQMETHRPATRPGTASSMLTTDQATMTRNRSDVVTTAGNWWPGHNAECQAAVCSKYCQLCPIEDISPGGGAGGVA